MLKVVQLIDSTNVGGAQRLLVTFARATHDLPVTLRVVSLRRDDGSPIPGQLSTSGVGITYFPAGHLLSPTRIRKLVAWMRSQGPDIVHTHLTYANVVGAIAARLAGIPAVATLHNIRARKQRPATRALEAQVLRFGAQRIVAVSQTVADAHRERLGGRPMVIIPNAVPLPQPVRSSDTEALRKNLTGSADRPFLLSIGRLTPQKGFDTLLKAFGLVCRNYPDAFLAIAGSGELLAELSKQIQNLGLEGNARLLGQRDDVGELLAAADLYLNSSRWEGLSVALLEAMAAGTAVVATSVGETPNVLSEEMGILVPPTEPVLMAEAISSLLADGERRRAMGEQARQKVASQYEAAPWAQKILSLYREMVPEANLLAGSTRGHACSW